MRPELDFGGFFGQKKIVKRVTKLLDGAAGMGEVLKGFILKGLPGLGKSRLAQAIAQYSKVTCHQLECGSGADITTALVDILKSIERGEILYIDEAHILPYPICILLLRILDRDENVTLASFSGSKATEEDKLQNIPPIQLILATDQPALLPKALLTRLRPFTLCWYSDAELNAIVNDYLKKKETIFTPQAGHMIARVAKGSPREAITHADGVRYYTKAEGKIAITIEECRAYFKDFNICEETGLDEVDAKYLEALYGEGGKAFAPSTISSRTGIDVNTLIKAVEPYLLYKKLVDICEKGRCLTELGTQTYSRIKNRTIDSKEDNANELENAEQSAVEAVL